jgi:hypothetical protein
MSDDFETFLGKELGGLSADAPAGFDGAAVTGRAVAAARRRRRRQVVAAAGTACVLMIGAVLSLPFWKPVREPQQPANAPAPVLPAIEFVVRDDEGFAVINADGERVPLPDVEPSNVFRTARSYLVVSLASQSTVEIALDGTVTSGLTWPTGATSTTLNAAGTGFALASMVEADMTEYTVFDVPAVDNTALVPFKAPAGMTLVDWSDSIAVFSADAMPEITDNSEPQLGTEQLLDSLQSVGEAGFAAAAVVDPADPGRVCVTEFAPGLSASGIEQCGRIDTAAVKSAVIRAAGDEAYDVVAGTVARWTLASGRPAPDLGEFADEYEAAERYWADPGLRWDLACDGSYSDWVRVDHSDDGSSTASAAEVPEGAIMPVLEPADGD